MRLSQLFVRHAVLLRKAARYAGFGVVFAAIYFAIFYVAQRFFGLQAWAATLVGYMLIVPAHYVIHARFTFQADLDHQTAIPRQVAWQIASCLIGALLTQALVGFLHASLFIAALIGTLVVNGLSFAVSLMWVFVSKPKLVLPEAIDASVSNVSLAQGAGEPHRI